MTQRKSEYETNGHEVTIQQVNEGGSISFWIDGRAGYADKLFDNLDVFPKRVSSKIVRELDVGDRWEAIKTAAAFMVSQDVYFCPKCQRLYPCENVTYTGFAGHKCGKCANDDNTCKDGGDHDMKCTNPHQKHSARVSTKYKCQKCGYKRKTVPTG